MSPLKPLGAVVVVAAIVATLAAGPAWADDVPPADPPATPADPAPAPPPRTAADVPPLVSEPLTASLGGPESAPYDVDPSTPLDPSTQSVRVVVPYTPANLPPLFPIAGSWVGPQGRVGQSSGTPGRSGGTMAQSAGPTTSASSPSTTRSGPAESSLRAWAAIVAGGHSLQWNLWRLQGRVIDFSRAFSRHHPRGTGAGGGGI